MKPKNKTILILEDERPLLKVIKTRLETEGFSVLTARSVNQALQRLKDKTKIDAVWLDHYLFGKKDGLDFINGIKKTGSARKNLPIFLISNTASAEKINAYLKLGVKKYYPKTGYQLEKIIADIKKVLN